MLSSSTTRLQVELSPIRIHRDRRDASWSGVSAPIEEAPLRFSARGRPLYNVARLPSGASSPLRAGGYDSDYWAYDDGYGSPSGRSRGTGRGQGHDPTYHGAVGGSPRAGGGKERAPRPPREPGPPQPKKSHTGKGKEGLPHRKGAAQMAEAAAQAAAEAALRDAASAALAEDEAKALAEKAAREAIAAVAADFRRGGKFFRTMPALGKRKSENERLAGDAEDADSAGDGSDGSKGSKSKKQKVGAAGAGSKGDQRGKGAADGQTAGKRGRAPSQKLVDAAAASPSAAPVRVRVRNANVIKRQPGMSLAEAAAAAAAENVPAVSPSEVVSSAKIPAGKPKAAKAGKAKVGNMAAPAPGRRGRSAVAVGMDGPAVPQAEALPAPVKKRKAAVLGGDNPRSSDALQQLPIKKRKSAAAAASAAQANLATTVPAGNQRSSQAKPAAVLPKASKPAKTEKQTAKAGPRGKPPAARGKPLVQSASNGAAPGVSKGAASASASGRARQTKAVKKSSKTAPAGPLRRGRSGVQ